MRKSDKKFDNDLRKALTRLCENELEQFEGFQWLTHVVNYPNIQSSLKVVCVFDSNDNLERFLSSADKASVELLIMNALSELKVKLKKPSKHILFDSEENCSQFHNGNWEKRLA